MTYELAYFLFLLFVGLYLCIAPIKSRLLYDVTYILLFIGYSLVTRYSGFDVDILTYESALRSDSTNIYYLKEPVYWILSRYIFDILGSAELTFFVYDVLVFILILKAVKNFNLPQYFPFLYFLFFPSVFGINNVLRQFISYSFFYYFLSLVYINARMSKKTLFFILSVLTHNVAALFLPISFMLKDRIRLNITSIFTTLGVFLLIPLAVGTKSFSDTGDVNPLLYLSVIFITTTLFLAVYRLKINNNNAKYFYMLLYFLCLNSFTITIMGSAQSKRVGMFTLLLILIPITKIVEEFFVQKRLARVILYITFILPTFIFQSSLKFLMTAKI